MADLSTFTGKGIKFPIEIVNGTAVITSGEDLINSSLKIILSWPVGQRIFLAQFGSRTYQLIEEPNDEFLETLVDYFIVEAISRWDRRVEVLDSQFDSVSEEALEVSVTWRIKKTDLTGTFIFPFYRNLTY